MQTVPSLIQMGWQPRFGSVVGCSDLCAARNTLFAQAYVENYDKTLLVDSDMSWAPGTVERLVSAPVDLVGAAYRMKMEEDRYAVKTFPGDFTFVDPTTGEPHPFGLLEVAGVGTGLLCISKKCIHAMVEHHKDEWYKDKEVQGEKAWNVFRFTVEDHERCGEDIGFCQEWGRLGGKVWIDPFLVMHHHGDSSYSGVFANHVESAGKLNKDFAPLLTEARKSLPPLPSAA